MLGNFCFLDRAVGRAASDAGIGGFVAPGLDCGLLSIAAITTFAKGLCDNGSYDIAVVRLGSMIYYANIMAYQDVLC